MSMRNSRGTRQEQNGHWHNRKQHRAEDITLDDLNFRDGDADFMKMRNSSHNFGELGGTSEDDFQREVATKTQKLFIGRQEAETEVFIDRLVKRHQGNDMALLYVVAEMAFEPKVVLLVSTLINRGANPSASNTQLQTPLHFAVKRNFRMVAAKLLENDALPHVRDKNGLLPLKIAIDNENDDIAALLLNFMPNNFVRSLFVSNGESGCEFSFHELLRSEFPKTVRTVLDCMIESYGNCDRLRVYYHVLDADESGRSPKDPQFNHHQKSPLQILAKQGDKNTVYHDTVRLIVRRKWKKFARTRFQFNAGLYMLTLFAVTFSAIVAVSSPDPTKYNSPIQIVRAVFEVGSLVMVCFTILTECNQFRKLRLEYFHDAFNWIDSASSVLLLTVVPLRFTHSPAQWHVFAFGFLLWFLRIFKYAAVFRQLGAYAQILFRVLANDFLQFGVVFLVILVAFSGAFLLSLRGDNDLSTHNETSSFWSILFVGARILIEAESVVDYTGPDGFQTMSTIFMVGFLFGCLVILLNLLIAQLSDTYQNVQQDAQRGLEVNRAWIVAKVELNSWYCGKDYRSFYYKEYEDIADLRHVLEKWDSPPLNEMNRCVQDIWDSLDGHKMNLLTVKHRMARQVHTLRKIQDQLNILIGLQTGKLDEANIEMSLGSSKPRFNLTSEDPLPKASLV